MGTWPPPVGAFTVTWPPGAGANVFPPSPPPTEDPIVWVSSETILWVSGENIDWVS